MSKSQLISEVAFDLVLAGFAHADAIDTAVRGAKTCSEADRDQARTLFWGRQARS